MKNLSLKNKILLGIASALALVILAFLIWTIVAVAVGMAPPKDIVTAGEYDFTFDGKITLNEVEYDVSLNGKDDKFTVDAGKIKDVVGGSYKFTDGQGWTFTFDDAGKTVVRSQFDDATKTFAFIYRLDMGSRGIGNLKLSHKDENFKRVGEAWSDIPAFSGTAKWFGGVVSAVCSCACDADGNFTIFEATGAITPISGTYAFENGACVLTTDDGEVITASKNADGLYEFETKVFRPALAAYGDAVARVPVVFTQVVLTVD